MRPLRLALAGLILLSASVACGDTAEQQTFEQPTLTITKPIDGSTVIGETLKVEAYVQNFRIIDKLGQPPVAGEGHVHFYIDVDEIPTAQGKPAIVPDDPKLYHATATKTHTWKGVEPGEHTIAVQLVNNNHTPLDPPVTTELTVTVKKPEKTKKP